MKFWSHFYYMSHSKSQPIGPFVPESGDDIIVIFVSENMLLELRAFRIHHFS